MQENQNQSNYSGQSQQTQTMTRSKYCNRSVARENACEQVMVDIGLVPPSVEKVPRVFLINHRACFRHSIENHSINHTQTLNNEVSRHIFLQFKRKATYVIRSLTAYGHVIYIVLYKGSIRNENRMWPKCMVKLRHLM